jgi:hypothetical protein
MACRTGFDAVGGIFYQWILFINQNPKIFCVEVSMFFQQDLSFPLIAQFPFLLDISSLK